MSDDLETARAAFIEASFWHGPLDQANAIDGTSDASRASATQ
jgi:hypothetical protein